MAKETSSLSLTMESFSTVEPMRKNRFLVQFQNLGSEPDNNGKLIKSTSSTKGLTVACHSCSVPKLSVEEQTLHRFNDRVYVPGKGEFDAVDFEFYEYINQTNTGEKSAGNLLWQWLNQIYNPSTGASWAKNDIKSNVLIAQFDGEGTVVRTWNLYYAWPTTVEYDGFDSTSDDVQNVKVTLRYDWASMNEDIVADGADDTDAIASSTVYEGEDGIMREHITAR